MAYIYLERLAACSLSTSQQHGWRRRTSSVGDAAGPWSWLWPVVQTVFEGGLGGGQGHGGTGPQRRPATARGSFSYWWCGAMALGK